MRITIDTTAAPAFVATGELTNLQIGYAFFRVFAGVNLFLHGFMRLLGGVTYWEVPTAETFADTFLPMPLVHLALWLIPFVQVVIGACMTLGLMTRWAFIGGLALMLIILFGHLVRQNWSGAHICMHYGLYYWIMLALMSQNRMSLDARRGAEG